MPSTQSTNTQQMTIPAETQSQIYHSQQPIESPAMILRGGGVVKDCLGCCLCCCAIEDICCCEIDDICC